MSEGIEFTITAKDLTAAGISSAEGNFEKLVADAKKLQDAQDKVSGALKNAGVSQSAFNKVVQQGAAVQKSSMVQTAASLFTYQQVGKALMWVGKQGVEAYKSAETYAGQIRDLSAISGTSAEETSRFVQVLDDFQITTEDVTAATKALTRQGLTPNIETLAKLSDQYNAINDPMEKNAFLIKNLGKSGLGWTNAMKAGGAELRQMSLEINRGNIFTDQNVATMETARLEIDKASDAWAAAKNSVGLFIGEQIVSIKNQKDLTDTAYKYNIVHDGMNDRMKNNALEKFSRQMEKGAATTAFYTAQQKNAAGANNEVTMTAEELEAKQQAALQGGLALTDMTTKYDEKSKALNASLAEQTTILQNMQASGYGPTNQKLVEQTALVNNLKQSIASNNADQVKSQQEYLSSVLATKKASTSLQLAFAVASGQITQGAANQQIAVDKVSEAMMNGAVSAQTGAAEIAALMAKVKGLDGKHANTYIDVWIKEHTVSVMAAPSVESIASNKHAGQQNGEITGRAGGGPLDSRGWTLVGDRPGGIFIPGVSELIYNGFVYDSKTSEKIMRSGMIESMNSRAQGGDVFASSQRGTSVGKSKGAAAAKTFSRSKSQRGAAGAVMSMTDAAQPMSSTGGNAQVMQQMQIQQATIAATAANTDTLNQILNVLEVKLARDIGTQVGNKLAKFS